MRLSLSILLILCAVLNVAAMQERELDQLLDERDELYEKYKVYKNKKSSFWGTQSKKDLRRIVETLKEIIAKDTEIVMAIRSENAQSNQSLKSEGKNAALKIAELEEEVRARINVAANKQKEVYDLNDELKFAKKQKFGAHVTITILIILLAASIFYSYNLRKKLKGYNFHKT
ncbi:hypothetical protein QQ008_00670 [Fulvivirgaceae bacterium BMA10]|uniref:Uncharacterized protein n=1 Tax=Splendidivirga corallicola TaxID=3051826 RepID=A0ABT8KGL3_9BACT|nr:hypothetical protein [Fulvivirgaceae bacterium BMA10]